MQAKAHLIPEKIHLTNIYILNGEMYSPLAFDREQIQEYNTTYQFGLSFKLDESLVKADFEVELQTVSNTDINEEEATARFHLVYLFMVENLDDLAIVQKDGTIELQGGLGNVLASIAYSTTRGTLITRFQGTALADFILPVIDINRLL